MKKAAIALAVGALATTLAACGSNPTSNASGGFGSCDVTGKAGSIALTTQKPGVLTVATVLPNPGWWNGTNPSDVDSGFEYCMAADIAHQAGLTSVVVKNLAWDQYISGTATGFDVGIASTTITPDRKKVFDFSAPYFSSNLGVATKAGSNLTAADLKDAKIGVLQGNLGAQWVADVLKPTQHPATFQAQADMFTALAAGQVDAVVTDTTLALTSIKASNGILEVKGQFDLNQGYGVVLPRGSANSDQVSKAIDTMSADGTLDALGATYLQPLFGANPNDIPMWTLP